MSEHLAAQVFREAAEGVPTGQPLVDEVVALSVRRRRRRTTWVVGVASVTLVVVGIGTWIGSRPPDDGLPEATVHEEANPANIEWYADGVLHLARVTVEVPQISSMVTVPDGVVYADRNGRVILVEMQGKLTSLGRSVPGTPLVADARRGWVGWLEPGSTLHLVVHDSVARKELARRPVAPNTKPIAIDQDRFYYNERGESWSWQLPDIDPALVPRAELYDVASGVRVQRAGPGSMLINQPILFTNDFVAGTEATLSPDGTYVLTRVDLDVPEVVRLYDDKGTVLPTGLDDEDDEIALAAAFGPDDTISYVVGAREVGTDGDELLRLSESRSFELRTCELRTARCSTVTQVSGEHGIPVLPSN